jgi:hypothetical protein
MNWKEFGWKWSQLNHILSRNMSGGNEKNYKISTMESQCLGLCLNEHLQNTGKLAETSVRSYLCYVLNQLGSEI